MIEISDEFEYSLSNETQNVKPDVKAWMSDIRYLENLKATSSSHTVEKQISDRNPLVHVRFDKSRFQEIASSPFQVTVIISGNPYTTFGVTSDRTIAELGFYNGLPLYLDIRESGLSASQFWTPTLCYMTGLSTFGSLIIFNLTPNQSEAEANNIANSYAFAGSGTYVAFCQSVESRVEDLGSSKFDIVYGSAATGNPIQDRQEDFQSYPASENYYQSLQPKRLIDTFYRDNSTTTQVEIDRFSSNGSVVGADLDSQYYTWFQNYQKWAVYNNTLYSTGSLVNSGLYSNGHRYVKTFVNSLDNFIDFKVMPNNRGATVYARFIDEDNHISAYVDRPDDVDPIKIKAVVDGIQYEIASASQGTWGVSLSSTHYYRFEADYNTYSLYDMGTSEPTNASSGTLMCTGYFYDKKFREDDARWVGIGYSALGNAWSYSITPTNFYYDYFACYGIDYLSGAFYFDGTKYALAYRLYEYDVLRSYLTKKIKDEFNRDELFQELNYLNNFTYQFFFNKKNAGSGTQTIYWMGNPDVDAIQISYITSTNKLRIKVIDNDPYTVYTITSSASFSYDTLYHAAVTRDGNTLSLFIDGELDSTLTLPDSFEMPNILDIEPISVFIPNYYDSPYIMFGADGASNRLGDADSRHFFNGYISEFAIFDYALTNDDIRCIYQSMTNGGILSQETSDKYCNVDCIIDGLQEETFNYVFCNFLDARNSEIISNQSSYCVSPYSIATGTNSIKDNFGWISRTMSDSAGNFSDPDFIKIEFDPAKCNKIFVTTGYNHGPVAEFDYEVEKSDYSIISGSSDFAGESFKFIELDDDYEIISIKITPISTSNPYDYARIFTVNPIWEVDLSDLTISFSLDKVRENLDASLPIGATAANNGSITLDNTEKLFNIFEDSIYGNYTNPDTIFFISLEHDMPISSGSTTMKISDYMYADDWSFSNSSMTVEVSLRDYSKFLQEETVRGYIGQNTTAGTAVAELAMSSGFPSRRISYQKKFSESIMEDGPSVYYRFSTDDYVIGSAISEFYDTCGTGVALQDENLAIASGSTAPQREGPIEIAGTILFSETLFVQDLTNRIADSEFIATFEPYYNSNSIKVEISNSEDYDDGTLSLYEYYAAASSVGIAYWNPYKNTSSDWTTEIVHYYKEEGIPDLATDEGEFIQTVFPRGNIITIIDNNTAGSPVQGNFCLGYRINDTNGIKYSFWIFDSSSVKHSIETEWLDASIPHLLSVRKTIDTDSVFDLFIDGDLKNTLIFSGTEYNSASDIVKVRPSNSYISDFVYYDYSLSNDRIYNHYLATALSLIPTYRILYGSDETYWDSMLTIATADLGMFYLDEYGILQYEYRNTLHEELFDRYQIPQYAFSDSKNIVSGEYTSEVQTNKVTVKINNLSLKTNQDEVLWEAEDGESLAVTLSTESISPASDSIQISSVTDPQWTDSGYIKIDNEIIKYSAISGSSLVGLSRGLFGTRADWHLSGTLVREARYYQIQYSSTPAFNVKYPLITSEDVDLDYFIAGSYYAEIVVSAKDSVSSGSLVILQGKNPITDIDQFFEIVGRVTDSGSGNEFVSEESAEIIANIRRYRLKAIEIDNVYIQNKLYAKIMANHIISYYANPVKLLKVEVLGVPQIQVGDLVNIEEFYDLGITNKKFWVIESSMSYDGGIQQNLSLLSYSDPAPSPESKFAAGAIFPV